jgi:hypothetical protein
MSPDAPPKLRAHLALLGRTLAVLAAVVVPLMATRAGCHDYAPGALRRNLAYALGTAAGLTVAAEDVALLEGGDPVRGRLVAFLGRPAPQAPRDVYLARARLTETGIPLAVAGPWNLSRTREADETDLTVRATRLACASRHAGRVQAVLTYDAGGEDPTLTASWPATERLLDRVTNFQESGAFAGVGRVSLELTAPTKNVRLAFVSDDELWVSHGGRRIVFDAAAATVREGADVARVVTADKGRRTSLITWAVDTVRNLSFVGPEKIAWLEHVVFKAMDRVQVVGAKVTGYDGAKAIAEDLDLKVAEPAPAGGPTVPNWPPQDLAPILPDRMEGEGRWVLRADAYTARQPGLPSPFAETFLRVDAERPFARVYMVVWDPRRIDLHLVPGTDDPQSMSGKPGSGRIPRQGGDLERLAAGFSGGWQTVHGHFGMRAQGATVVSPCAGCATFGRMRGGATAFGTWPKALRGKSPDEIVEYRQNLYPLFDHGVLNPDGHAYWGGGHLDELEVNYVRRSGLCATQGGHVVYFYGEHVTIYTLARAMQQARCDYGLELDINRPNVSFEYYRVLPKTELTPDDPPLKVHEVRSRAGGEMPGRKDLAFFARSLVRGQGLGGFPRYVATLPRDFVYLTLRDVLPGAPLAPPISPPLPGEGAWQTAGLPQGDDPFPAALATTTIRPDPARPDVSVRLLKVDLRRVDVAVGPSAPAGAVLAEAHLGGPAQVRSVGAGEPLPAAAGLLVDGGGAEPPRVVAGALGGARAERGGVVVGPAAAGAPAKGSAAATLAACTSGSFLVLAQAPGDDPDAAARALALCGCRDPVRLSAPQAAGHLVLEAPGARGRAPLAPGEQALFVVAHARPSLVPMFSTAPAITENAPPKKVDGEAILKRALLRSRNPNATAPGAPHHDRH